MKTLTDARNYSKSRNPHDGRALKVLAFSQADIGYQSQRPQGAVRLLFNSVLLPHSYSQSTTTVVNLSLFSPYVELVNILLSCGEEVKEALTRSVRLQCEQNWGALCDSLSLCSSLSPSPSGSTVEHRHVPSHPEQEHPRPPRQGDKERHGKVGFSAHPRSRSQGPRRQSPEAGVAAEREDPETTNIRR